MTIAQDNTPQELMAALVWQRRFNEFDGPEVITDLAQQPHLWKSFLFTKPIYAPDRDGLSLNGVLETLLAMANYRPMPETSLMHFVPYPRPNSVGDRCIRLCERQSGIDPRNVT